MQTVRYVGMLSLIASGSFTSLHSTKCQLEHRCSSGHSPLSARHECECDATRAERMAQCSSTHTALQDRLCHASGSQPSQWPAPTVLRHCEQPQQCSALRSLRRILPAGSIRRLT